MDLTKPTNSQRSLRLWFRFAGDQVELVRQEPVQMIAPPLVGDVPKKGEHIGTWVELQSASDQRISSHHAVGDPFHRITEQVIDGKMCAAVRAVDCGMFDIVVPDHPEARSVLLVSSRDRDSTRSPKAANLTRRFELKGRVQPAEKPR